MNINIQVDKSLFSSSQHTNQMNGGGQNNSGVMVGTTMNGMANSPCTQRHQFEQNNMTFTQANNNLMQRPSNNYLNNVLDGNSSSGGVPSTGMQQMLNVNNNGSSLPPLNTNRSGNGNNHQLMPPIEQQYNNSNGSHNNNSGNIAEQYSVNVTITKVGNQLISSRVDISKQMLPEESEDQDSELVHKQKSSLFEHSFFHQKSLLMQELEKFRQERLEREEKAFEKYKKYDPRALFFINSRWRCRQKFIDFIRWKYYDNFMILSIAGNSICLALNDYGDDDNQTEWNQMLDKLDKAFTVVYVSEAIIKTVAFGFIVHKKSYMRDPWNVLDFFVVIIGIISLVPAIPNLKSFRTMRILRPLRSINAVPSMKRLVATLLRSLPQMGYLVSFLIFFISVFAILGMQIFSRDLYFRCRTSDQPIFSILDNTTTWPFDPLQKRLCGGIYECNSGTYCHALIEKDLPLELDRVWEWDFVQYGFFHFDNIGISILSIFRVITLEGWTTVMYNYLDSSGFLAGLYFPTLVIIGSFFLLNLFLAVIMDTFSKMTNLQKEKMKEKQEMKSLKIQEREQLRISSKRSTVDKMINVTKEKMKIARSTTVKGGLVEAALLYYAKEKATQVELQRSKTGAANKKSRKSKNQEIIQNSPKAGNRPNSLLPPIKTRRGSMTEIRNREQDNADPHDQKKDKLEDIKEIESQNGSPEVIDQSLKIMDMDNEIECSDSDVEKNDEKVGSSAFEEIFERKQIGDATSAFKGNQIEEAIQRGYFSQKCFQTFLLKVCESKLFLIIINLSIVLNTFVLGLDSYPSNDALQGYLDSINIGFFALFFIEMVIKVLGMGAKYYIKDQFNIFDAFIVMLSIIDVCFSFLFNNNEFNEGKGAISAFRAIRLLRVFKLAKSWSKLKLLLLTILKSLKDISSFSVLLFLLMFIYVLLGMEIFAVRRNLILMLGQPDPSTIKVHQKLSAVNRSNFNNFFNGFIVVFTVLTGENWDETMFFFAREKGYIAIIFFISLTIIGVMIFLNLFLAILLENFDAIEEEADDNSFINSIQVKTITCFKILKKYIKIKTQKCCKKTTIKMNPEGVDLDNSIEDETPGLQLNLYQTQHIQIQRLGSNISEHDDNNQNNIPPPESNRDRSYSQEASDYNLLQIKPSKNLESIQEIENEDLSVSPSRVGNNSSKRRKVLKQQRSNSKNAIISDLNHSSMRVREIAESFVENLRPESDLNATRFVNDPLALQTIRNNIETLDLGNADLSVGKQHRNEGLGLGDSRTNLFRDSYNNTTFPNQPNGYVRESSTLDRPLSRSNKVSPKTRSFALQMREVTIRQSLLKDLYIKKTYHCEGTSLICLGRESRFRLFFTNLVRSPIFENLILILIGVSSILLALDNPINDPESTLVQFLRYADLFLTAFFLMESISKIISYGFIFNGKHSYLRNGWNIIDFTVVIISIISLMITSNKLKIVKILRLLRVLRPLRVISRNKGLKIGIQALFMAIPSLFNVIIVSALFFLIFGIIGANYFKGTFFSCRYGDQFPSNWQDLTDNLVLYKWDCLNLGGSWINADQHFDNVPEAMSTLFQMSTTEGWIDVMNRGVDSIGIDEQPQSNFNTYWALFFILFIVLGNFLILNLFVGVVVSTFNKEKENLGKNFLLTEKQRQWLDQKKLCMGISPKILLDVQRSKFRQIVLNMVQSRQFDIIILVCIIMNTVVLAINWYSQPVFIDDILDYVNYSFAVIFMFECMSKIIGFGTNVYFRETENWFDFVIVVTSIVSSIISIILNVDFGASTTFIRALRIARIFKYIKKSKQIKVIFETVIVTIPALTNIGGLLLLFLYIFSVLGVFLFAEVKLQGYLNIHANFQTFGVAFLTLLRCSTGEAWNYIMLDSVRQRSILFQCSDEDFDYQTYLQNGLQTNGCGSSAGIIFFMSYFLMVPLIFLNLFIAIILEGFEQVSSKMTNLISEDDLEKFRDAWALFDRNGTGYIKIHDLPELMMMLGGPLGWKNDVYMGNQDLQDDFFEELNIPTYNNFKEYLFYDVIQELTKIYMVRLHLKKKITQNKELITDEDIYVTENSEKIRASSGLGNQENLQDFEKDAKLELRLELEFENIDNEKKEVLDVEEVKDKEMSLRRGYMDKKDSVFSSAHIKAARKILIALQKLRKEKLAKAEAAIYGEVPTNNRRQPVSKYSQRTDGEGQISSQGGAGSGRKLIQGKSFRKGKSIRRNSVNISPTIKGGEGVAALTGRRPDDNSLLNSSNLNLLEDVSQATMRALEHKPIGHGISGVIREYEEFESEIIGTSKDKLNTHRQYSEESKQFSPAAKNDWGNNSKSQIHSSKSNFNPLSNKTAKGIGLVPQIILRPIIDSDPQSIMPLSTSGRMMNRNSSRELPPLKHKQQEPQM